MAAGVSRLADAVGGRLRLQGFLVVVVPWFGPGSLTLWTGVAPVQWVSICGAALLQATSTRMSARYRAPGSTYLGTHQCPKWPAHGFGVVSHSPMGREPLGFGFGVGLRAPAADRALADIFVNLEPRSTHERNGWPKGALKWATRRSWANATYTRGSRARCDWKCPQGAAVTQPGRREFGDGQGFARKPNRRRPR